MVGCFPGGLKVWCSDLTSIDWLVEESRFWFYCNLSELSDFSCRCNFYFDCFFLIIVALIIVDAAVMCNVTSIWLVDDIAHPTVIAYIHISRRFSFDPFG